MSFRESPVLEIGCPPNRYTREPIRILAWAYLAKGACPSATLTFRGLSHDCFSELINTHCMLTYVVDLDLITAIERSLAAHAANDVKFVLIYHSAMAASAVLA